jgi:hypothetical protein
MMKWVRYVACMGEIRNVYKTLVGWNRPLQKLKCRSEDNININLREIGLQNGDWIQLAQNRDCWWTFVNMVINLLFH